MSDNIAVDEYPAQGVSKERSLWELAREAKRRNDLLEVEMLCKTAETVRSAAKSSCGSLHDEGWAMAEELALMAHQRITQIVGTPAEVLGSDESEP